MEWQRRHPTQAETQLSIKLVGQSCLLVLCGFACRAKSAEASPLTTKVCCEVGSGSEPRRREQPIALRRHDTGLSARARLCPPPHSGGVCPPSLEETRSVTQQIRHGACNHPTGDGGIATAACAEAHADAAQTPAQCAGGLRHARTSRGAGGMPLRVSWINGPYAPVGRSILPATLSRDARQHAACLNSGTPWPACSGVQKRWRRQWLRRWYCDRMNSGARKHFIKAGLAGVGRRRRERCCLGFRKRGPARQDTDEA